MTAPAAPEAGSPDGVAVNDVVRALVPDRGDRLRGVVAGGVLFAVAWGVLASGLGPAESHVIAAAAAAVAFAALPGGHAGDAGRASLVVTGTRPVTDRGSLLRYIAVTAVGLGAGAAVVATLLDAGASAGVVALGAAAVESCVLAVGTACVVRTAPGDGTSRRLCVFAYAAVAASVLLRVVFAPSVQLIPEEAYYWNYAAHPALGYLDHPPLVAWLLAGTTAVLGTTETAVRLVALACWCVTLWFTVRLTRRLAGETAAAIAAMLVATLPAFLALGFATLPDAPMLACWSAALWFFARAMIDGRRGAWWAAGVALGLGALSKYPIALVAASAAVFALRDRDARRWFRRPEPYVAAAIACALFTPVIVWNAQNDWASFTFQSVGRIARPRFDLHSFVGASLLAATPLGAAALWAALRRRRAAVEEDPVASPADLDVRARRFCLVFTVVPLTAFAIASLRAQIRVHWPAPCVLAAIPAMAWAIAAAPARAAGDRMFRFVAAWTRPTIAVTLVLFALAGHVFALGVPFAGYPFSYGVDWRDLASAVGEIVEEVTAADGARPVVAGLDRNHIASELSFHRAGQDVVASNNLLGGRGVMFERWAPAETLRGRTVVLVGDSLDAVLLAAIGPRFESLEPVRTIVVRRRGIDAGTWYVRVGRNYRPPQLADVR